LYVGSAARRLGAPPRTVWLYTIPGAAALYERRWQRKVRRTPAISPTEHLRRTGIREIEEIVSCSLCGESRFQPLFEPYERTRGRWSYQVVRCPSCGFLYRNPGIRAERLADLYAGPRYVKFLTGKYEQHRRRRYSLAMDAFSPLFAEGRGRRLLDYGCGAGLFLELAHERGFDGYGVDLSPDAVKRARERPGGANAHVGMPAEVPEIAAGGFDVITMWSVLAHLPRPVADVEMLRNLLAPDGVLSILTVNANSLELKARGSGWNGFTRNHLVFFSPATVALLLGRAGFGALVIRPAYGDAVELGTVPLRRRHEQRLRHNVDRGNQSNMLRAVAFVSETGPESWGLERDAVRLAD
jgi:2-polyprenyl-3-methyl-5-hydroxy-6-metoxy-1,4-benzoquinol methylase